ncbi:flagellar hook protein FlgE [Roseibacterium sp. SDUM158017]|uniref:flagellar hook protein FlgE n=1 Tax=Roseicyclus salinarum TaxID=3036773 RepID=UPI0024156720|nr:flagellar hook protein FlgE [Roseibacterium sp. SDUM158017]MDG4648649.1 flagellar hook protein FlgE [Roseibacterium sp. SDUM158017]
MSITSAMQNGVSGLKANATAVGNISSNIANAGTDGYRRSFAQMVSSTVAAGGGNSAPPGGVRAVQTSDINADGQLRMTGRSTDLAISGQGFFVVSKNPNDPAQSNYMLTRAGSFKPDENGDLRNAAGFYLSGFPYDANGTLQAADRNSFGGLSTVNVGSGTIPGQATTAMSVRGNVPAQETGLATPGDPFISSAGLYTPLGASERVQMSWQPTATANRWTLAVSDEGGAALGSVTVDFHGSGPTAGAPSAYSGAAGFTSFDVATGTATLTIGGGTQTFTLDLGAPDTFDGLTQFAGDYSPLDVTADGSASGTLTRTEVTDSGDIYGIFDNGMRRALYNVPLAVVPNPNGLLATNGNAYLVSSESGPFELATPSVGGTGTVTAGALESSNVEIAEELTSLIQIQRAYSSNAKIVTTVDEMLDETMRIKR